MSILSYAVIGAMVTNQLSYCAQINVIYKLFYKVENCELGILIDFSQVKVLCKMFYVS